MIYVGIDVAKTKHDVCILNADGGVLSSFVIANDKDGFNKLVDEIKNFSHKKDLSDVKTGLESTGHYSLNITNFLMQKTSNAINGICVRIFNPLQVSLLRKAQTLRKTKTDKSDANFLATMLFSEESKPHQLPVLTVSELKIHTRNRNRLIKMRTRYKHSISRLITILFPELPSAVWSVNQKSCYALLLEFPTAKEIANAHLTKLTNLLSNNSNGRYGREKAIQIKELAANSIGCYSKATGFELQQAIRLIQNLNEEIAVLDLEIKKLMDEIDSPIMTVPGIGYILGAIIISEIGNIENFSNPGKLLKFAGLEPSVYESGNYKSKDTPMVKRGSPYLRWALLQAARLVAYRDETFHRYQEKKIAEGKHFFVAQSHVAKKLVRVLFCLLKNNQVFSVDKVA